MELWIDHNTKRKSHDGEWQDFVQIRVTLTTRTELMQVIDALKILVSILPEEQPK